MANVRNKYYWDACVWIELITRSNDDRFERCSHIFSKAQSQEVELWTSAFTLAEVYKRKCNGNFKSLDKSRDDEFELLFKSGLVKQFLLTFKLHKPPDGNVDELHTFDQKDLISLNGQIPLGNGNPLKITKPPTPPRDPQLKIPWSTD